MDITHEMIWDAINDSGRFVTEDVMILDGDAIGDDAWDAAHEWQEGDESRVLIISGNNGNLCEAWVGGSYANGSMDCVERLLDKGHCDSAIAAAACFHGVLGNGTPLLDGDDFAAHYAANTWREAPARRSAGPIDGTVWGV